MAQRRRSSPLLLGGVLAALALSGLAGPAAASSHGTIAVVNGIPGAKVDICLNGNEVKSGLPYGGRVFRAPPAGDKLLKVFRADPRRCRGTLLASKAFPLAVDADLTLVATKKAPKVLIFDNSGMGVIPPDGVPLVNAPFAWRHAADLGEVNFRYILAEPETAVGPVPAVAGIWVKGSQLLEGVIGGTSLRLRATPPAQKEITLARSKLVTLATSRRYEWYLVGTKRKNARFVVFSRAVSNLAL